MEKTAKMISNTGQLIQDFFRKSDIVIEPKDIKKHDIKRLIVQINKNVEEPQLKGMIHHDLCDIVVIVFLATMCGCEAWFNLKISEDVIKRGFHLSLNFQEESHHMAHLNVFFLCWILFS